MGTAWDPNPRGSSRHTGGASLWGYYGTAVQGSRGVTQGDPLFSTIFNVVVDRVVRHWVTEVIADAEERGELGKEGRHQAALFYTDDVMVASYDPH